MGIAEDFGWAKNTVKEIQQSIMVDPKAYELISKLHLLRASNTSIGTELVGELDGDVAKEKMTHLQV